MHDTSESNATISVWFNTILVIIINNQLQIVFFCQMLLITQHFLENKWH